MSLTVSFLVFMAVSTLTGLVCSLFWGSLAPWVSWCALALGVFAAVGNYAGLRTSRKDSIPPGFFDYFMFGLFPLLTMPLFLGVFGLTESFWQTLREGWIQLPTHIAMIKTFLNNPIDFSSHPFITHAPMGNFGMEFFTALFLPIGISLSAIVPVLSIICMVLTMAALYQWARGIGLAGFLFLGGSAGFLFVFSDQYISQNAMMIKNLVTVSVLPVVQAAVERNMLFAFPAGLVLLVSWSRRFGGDEKPVPILLEALLLGVMPVFHFATFVMLSALLLIWGIFSRKIFQSLKTLALSLVPALPLCFLSGRKICPEAWRFIFPGNGSPDQLIFIIYGFGLFILLTLCSLLFALICRKKEFVFLLVFALVLLGLGLCFRFNSKADDRNYAILAWSFLMVLPAWRFFAQERMKKYARGLLLIFIFLPGFWVHTAHGKWFRQVQPVISQSKIDIAREMLKSIPSNERVLTELEIHHPVPLSGHRTVMSYNDFLFEPRSRFAIAAAKTRGVLMGNPEWMSYAESLGARYLYWGEIEKKNYGRFEHPWQNSAATVASTDQAVLYDLGNRKPFAEVPEGGRGLRARFFNNVKLEGSALMTQAVPTIDFYWEDTAREVLTPPWGLVFDGEIYIPESGETTFYLLCDDDAEFLIDGKLIIENKQSGGKIISGTVSLSPGWYPVRVNHFDYFGGARILLWWELPSGLEQLIPQENFRHEQ